MKLKYTRKMVSEALSGNLDNVEYVKDPIFNVDIPKYCNGVPEDILNPREVWKDKKEYERAANLLASKFVENFAKKYPNMPENIVKAGPKAK